MDSVQAYQRGHTQGKPPQGSLLDRSGNLRRGAEHHASADMVEVGLTAPYAKYHEFGTAGRGSIPACAGETATANAGTIGSGVYPRMRGGNLHT